MNRRTNWPGFHLRILGLLAAVVLVLAACGGNQGGAQPTSAPATAHPAPGPTSQPTPAGPTDVKNPNTIIEATIGDPESLDPAYAYDTASAEVIQNVYETLLFPKQDLVSEFVPMLASEWSTSDDGKTYTWTIRDGVSFHGGQPLTAEDVAYTFWRGMIQDRSGGPQWILLQPFFGLAVQSFKDDVVAEQFNGDWAGACNALKQKIAFDSDARTVTMNLAQPYGPMLQVLTGSWAAIVSKPWAIEQGGWDGDCAKAEQFHDPTAEKDPLFKVMNGTGPYKLDRWAPGEEVALVRNDSYWLKQPLWDGGPSGPAKVQRAVIKNVSEWGTRLASFQAGDADIIYVPRQYIAQIDQMVAETCDATGKCTQANTGGFARLFKGLPSVSADTVFFNQQVDTSGGTGALGSGALDGNGVPPDFFKDIHVRKAFNACFDWQTYIDQIWSGEAQQARGPIIEGLIGYDPNQLTYKFDLDACAQEFKASTRKAADGASLWDTGFYLQYIYNSGNDQRRTAGEILKNSLSQVNDKFQLAIVEQPWPVFLKGVTNGQLPLYMLGWHQDFNDPHNWVTPYMASGGTYAAAQHFDPELQGQIDQLILEGVQGDSEQERAPIYQQLQNIAYDNALDIFVVQPQNRHYEQSWVHGWYYNPTYPGIYFYALSKGT